MINTKALTSTFKPESPANKVAKADFKRNQAVFYTLRQLMWGDSKSRVFWDGVNKKMLVPIAPGVRLADGHYSRPEYDPADINDWYRSEQDKFYIEFDAAFISATTEEMVAYATKHFGKSLKDLLELNSERMAVSRNRA